MIFFLCLRTGVQGRGGYAKSIQVRKRGKGGKVSKFADFERTYFMDGP